MGDAIIILTVVLAIAVVFYALIQTQRRTHTRAILEVIYGDANPRFLELSNTKITVGRREDCDLYIPDRYVSRRHLQVVSANGKWFVQDLNSTDGTRVNGQPIVAQVLKNRDQIALGNTLLRFRYATGQAPTRTGQAPTSASVPIKEHRAEPPPPPEPVPRHSAPKPIWLPKPDRREVIPSPRVFPVALQPRFRPLAWLGTGGMADVWHAEDTNRQTEVAVKVLIPDLAEDIPAIRRFRQEAEVLALLKHPNIVRIYELVEARASAALVLEYIEGPTLEDFVQGNGKPLSNADILCIVEGVCQALEYAHTSSVVHRDVKPANIMLSSDGRVVVGDFGIAKVLNYSSMTNSRPGTPAYMSPEQCRGVELDGRSDIYSLSITLYYMLTGGHKPFNGESRRPGESTIERLYEQHIREQPPAPSTLNAQLGLSLTPEIDAVVLRGLQKHPDARFRSAKDFAEAVRHALMVEEPF
jgi:hypothetical protein